MVDVEAFKKAFGVKTVVYDTQIEGILALCDETDPTLLKFQQLCYLEKILPQVAASVKNYSVDDISESFELPKGMTWCDLYNQKKIESTKSGNVGFGSGKRFGLPNDRLAPK